MILSHIFIFHKFVSLSSEYFEDHSDNMDQNQHSQPTREISPPTQEAGKNQNQSNHMMAPTSAQSQTLGLVVPSSYPIGQQYAPQYMYRPLQDDLQQLNDFWAEKHKEIENTTNFRTHGLPLARIKKIMKVDRNVKMVSGDTPVIFSKACELFIQELTMRAWTNAEVNKRRTLQKGDIASAITRSDEFDFLVDIVPRDNTIEKEVFAGIPRTGNDLSENVPYYYMPPYQHVASPSYGALGMVLGRHVLDQNNNGEQTHTFPTQVRPNPK